MPAKLPTNAALAEQFELLADMLELDGADAFRLAAYRRAASRIQESAVPVAQLAIDGKATRLSGIGGTIEAKIVELTETGDLAALAKLRDKLPPGLVDVMHVPGLGPKTARKLWGELGIESLDDLKAAAEQERLRGLPGLGAKTEEKVLKALAKPARASANTGRTLLGKVLPAVRRAVEEIEESGLADRVSEAGSVRRRAETSRDLDLIATAEDPAALTAFFAERPWVAEVVAKGSTKATVVSHDGHRFDLRVVPPESYGNLLQHFTGSKDHNVALREDAVRRGLSISEYGVKNVETEEIFQRRRRGGALRASRLRLDPARAAREPGRAGGRAGAAAAGARHARRPQGRSPHAHGLVGRPRDARGDGARGQGAGPQATSPSATTPGGCATDGSSARPRRSPP